jgi:hypothetical protein
VRWTGYRVVSWADLYGGRWLVVRMSDLRVMALDDYPTAGMRWISVWGAVSAGAPGQSLDPRAQRRLERRS